MFVLVTRGLALALLTATTAVVFIQCHSPKTAQFKRVSPLIPKYETLQGKVQIVKNDVRSLNQFSVKSDPCHPDKHTVISDLRRWPAEGSGSLCDNTLVPGWYRFRLKNSSAVIPTYCVPYAHCHAWYPTWLDLQGQALPPTGKKIEARACSNSYHSCCEWSSRVIVKNCGSFYVYNLNRLANCPSAYCAQLPG
ncbi:hypothetical protein ACOMHN_030190 [Nucella lapillus]